MSGPVTEFTSIFQENGLEPGKLRMAETGLGWKGEFETKASTIPAADLKWMQWMRVARGFQLRIGLKGEKRRVACEGFEREDHERLRNAVNHYYNITLEEKDTSVRGWNWGYADIQGDDLAFLVAGKPAFTVPLNTVHNTSINKAEVALEFRDENMLAQIKKLEADRDNKEARRMRRAAPDEMVEVRFYIPGTVGESRRRGKQAKKDASDADKVRVKGEDGEDEEKKPSRDSGSEAEDEEDEDQAAAETFFETIKEKAEIGQVQGETLVSFPDILCTTPRGRFDVDMFPDFLRLRGKTYDYKIMYSSIVKLFLLPRTDDIHVQFIINLEPPIRQGQTRYPYFIMQFAKEEEMDAEIQMDEKEIQEKYQGKLEKRYEAPAYEVISSIFRALSGKKVTIPGNFQSYGGHSAVKANFGAMEGHLFFLDKAQLYISRSPLCVAYNDISESRIERVSGALTTSGRTFDLIVQTKGSRNEHTYSALSEEEQNTVEDHLTHEKHSRVKDPLEGNVQAVNSAFAEALMDEDRDDEDAPGQRIGDDDEDSEAYEDLKADYADDAAAEEYYKLRPLRNGPRSLFCLLSRVSNSVRGTLCPSSKEHFGNHQIIHLLTSDLRAILPAIIHLAHMSCPRHSSPSAHLGADSKSCSSLPRTQATRRSHPIAECAMYEMLV